MSVDLLQPLVGRWEGQATVSPTGQEPIVLRHVEHVRTCNGGTILTIEGSSFPPEGADDADPVFTAFAVLTPDGGGALRLHAYSSGSFVETDCKVAEGRFGWTLPGPPSARYEATFDTDQWTEVGQHDGYEIFRMTLLHVQSPHHEATSTNR